MESPHESDCSTEGATDWADVSNDFARGYATLQEQHTTLTQRWERAKKGWLSCDREQSQNQSRLLKALNDHKTNAEYHITKLQRELKSAQNQSRKHTTTVNRLKKQRQDRDNEQAVQLKILKNDYCELQCVVEDMKSERKSLRSNLERETSQTATCLTEIGALKDKVSALELQNKKLQEELDTSHSQQLSMREEIESQVLQIVDAKTRLTASDETLKNIQLQMQKSCKLHQCSDNLRKLELMPGRLCDPTHLDFQFITDCGTLLCVDCCPPVSEAQVDGVFIPAMGLHFERNQCPWCFEQRWAWQRLDVPYSLAWAQEMEVLRDVIFGSST